MNISPRNQTLILASERRGQGGQTQAGTLSRALDAASGGGVLQRLTIVATRPNDELVYVQADYAPDNQRAVGSHSLVATSSAAVATTTGRDGYGNTLGRSGGAVSSPLRAVEQYAQTQRNGSSAPSVGLDVHA